MIKLSDNGSLESVFDEVTQKSLINNTTLRSFITPQVRKITPKLHQIRGRDIHIITKDTKMDLNIFRKIYCKIFTI